MSAQFPYKEVLVTGGSGYIASWIVRKLLERGASVRATVRDVKNEEKISHLLRMQGEYPGKLELFEADLGVQGSFDKAAEGCDGMIHSASPFFISNIKDAEAQLIRPAREGTLNVLQAASRSGSVKRVVLTSSVAAVSADNNDWMAKESGMLNDEDWNETADSSYQPYSYSKTLAERAAWDFAATQNQWSLVCINPSFVIGPAQSRRLDGTSASTIANIFSGQLKMGVPDLQFGMVDVRDVAEAHILALENNQAKGRFLLMDRNLGFMEVAKIMVDKYGEKIPVRLRRLPKALFYLIGPALGFNWRYTRNNYGVPVKIDSSRSRDVLGLEYHDVRQSLAEHAEQLVSDGLVKL